jgi:hypothetical protein
MEKITQFLKKIIKQIEKKELDDSNLQLVSKFYMEYKFVNENKIDVKSDYKQKEDFDDKELMQFIVLGWYMYQMMKN